MIKTKYPTTKPSLNLDFANTKSLDPRITFRRGTPGTYYDGVTHVKAEENLIDYSEDFSQWGTYELSVTSNSTTAPDGSTTADKISDSTVDGAHALYKQENYTRGTYIFSSFFKSSGDNRYIAFRLYNAAGYYIYIVFDPATGSVTHSENGGQSRIALISASSVSYANDWYRGIVMFNVSEDYSITTGWQITDSPVVNASSSPHQSTFAGDGSSGVYIWGAQLEQRDAVTSYTATTGTPITKYQPKLMTASPDDARFDHDPITGESKGLLIEEQRTNLIDYSEDFSSGGWNKVRLERVETDTIISPDGKLSGEKYIQEDGNLEGGNLNKIITLTSGITYTSSVYAKKGQFNQIRLFENNVNDSVETTIFSLDDGTLVSQSTYHDSYSITDIGNGWYRFSITFTASSTATTLVGFYLHDSSSVTGNGYKGTYIWGAQLETGSFPTSYIKTTGASATRSADNASITGENFSSWYRQDEGSIYCEAAKMNPVTSVIASLNDGTSNNRIFINLRSGENFEVTKSNNQEVLSGYTGLNAETYYKIAACYKKDSAAMSLGGQNSLSDTDCEVPGVDRLLFSKNYSSNVLYDYSMYIKKLAYYPQRLTNEQLQNLTK